jgi:hypothetical protein
MNSQSAHQTWRRESADDEQCDVDENENYQVDVEAGQRFHLLGSFSCSSITTSFIYPSQQLSSIRLQERQQLL